MTSLDTTASKLASSKGSSKTELDGQRARGGGGHEAHEADHADATHPATYTISRPFARECS